MLPRLLPLALLLCLAVPGAAAADPAATSAIVGGRTADAGDWPSIAFLLPAWDADGDGVSDTAAGCTGTVIAPDWIVTAAHCAFRPNGAGIDDLLTLTGVADINGPGEAIAADRLVVHPSWEPRTLHGDAMLVHLAGRSSRPAMALPRAGVTYGLDESVPNAAGWGMVDEDSTIGTDVLQEAFLDILDGDEGLAVCRDFAPDLDGATQLCAGRHAVAGVCHGDSGGPLAVLDRAGVPHLWGLTSYGPQVVWGAKPCARTIPAVFTRVSAYLPWIVATTGVLGPSQPTRPSTAPGDGSPGPWPGRPVPTGPADRTAPVLSRAKLSVDRIRAARRGATVARRAGARLSFALSEAAAVRVTVLRGRRALRPAASIAASAGRTTRRFTGRLGGRRLAPGRYRLQLAAVDSAGNAAAPVRLPFRLVR